tara:strand:+ start:3652 stop:4272 length:621 start_codon:yes stop_codon:yes gene_type:complete
MSARLGHSVIIPGEVGDIEACLHAVEGSKALAVVCHPHPLHQGTMNNKVVMALTYAMLQAGISVIRFNYRGVGKSAGQYGNIFGEVNDAQTVGSWASAHLGVPISHWAGFSFGSFVAAKQVTSGQQLIMVAPAVKNMPFEQLTSHSNTLVIMATDDEVVSYSDVKDYLQSGYTGDQIILNKGGHFFHGRTVHVRELVCAWLCNSAG